MKKNILAFSLLTIFALFVSQNVQAQAVQKNSSESCFTATRCYPVNTTCNTINDPPIGHRASLDTTGGLIGNETVFFYECFHLDGPDPLCIPAPISSCDPSGTCSLVQENVSWKSQSGVFKDTFKQICKQKFADAQDSELETNCEVLASKQIDYLNSQFTQMDYVYKGLFTQADGGIALNRVLNLPKVSTLARRYEWGSSNNIPKKENKPRSFKGVSYTTQAPPQSGTAATDQLGQLFFVNSIAGACNTVSWDPYGRVFAYDPTSSTNFEPIEDAWVGLYNYVTDPLTGVSKYQKYPEDIQTGLTNPQQTWAMGDYSFVVPDGTYRLQVKKTNDFPDFLDEVSLQVPENTISQSSDVLEDTVFVQVNNERKELYPKVYKASAPDILQSGGPQRRDVAVTGMVPKAIYMIEKQLVGLPSGNHILKGTISKPFGRVVVTLSSSVDKVLGQTFSDVNGQFTLVLDPKTGGAKPGDSYNISIFATPLILSETPQALIPVLQLWTQIVDAIVPNVLAVDVDVIPIRMNSLRGYAYDSSGNIMKNAEISVIETSTGMPFYATSSDAEGMFSIASNQLPGGGYKLMYKANSTSGSAQSVVVSQAEFLNKNKAFIEQSGFNVYAKTKADTASPNASLTEDTPEAVLTQKAAEKKLVETNKSGTVSPYVPSRGETPGMAKDQTVAKPMQSTSTMVLVYVVILILLVVGVGILVVYYLKKRQEPHLYE